MRSSWNFSTAIFEIWVLVLTKPGWANETPTTSLRVPREFNDYHHHQVQHQQPEQHHQHRSHHHHNHHYSVAGSTSRDFDSSSISGSSSSGSNHNHPPQSHYHHHPHSSSSYYSSSSNNNHYYSHHIGNNNHHLDSALASSSLLYTPHRCYVCLPPNKNSREAQQILAIFAHELRPLIPDCSAFDPYVDTGRFEFDCPPTHGGCILRIHGTNISRSCSKHRLNGCKKANSVEFCYCTTSLCNDKKLEPPVIPPVYHENSGSNSARRGSSSSRNVDGNSRTKSSVRVTDEQGINSQGIRTRVSEDDEDILNPDGEDDDDDTGSGTGSSDQEEQRHSRTYIDPYTSTMDPAIFHEDNFGIAVEDPKPHSKIGISMPGSTSGGSSSIRSSASSVTILGSFWWWWSSSSTSSSSSSQSLTRCWWLSCNSPYSQDSLKRIISGTSTKTRGGIFHLFLHLHRVLAFVRLFGEQVGGEDHEQLEPAPCGNIITTNDKSISLPHYCYLSGGGSQSQQEQEEGGCSRKSNVDAPVAPTTTTVLPLCFNSQLCFIISLVVVLKVLLS